MFNRLKDKWKVNNQQLVLIFCTFALGGSLCGRLGKIFLDWANIEKGALWVICYILLITLLWPICVLIISIPLGQFSFFKNYVARIGRRITGKKN